ncbi:Glutathione peroxidase 2 [Polyrhizophydium stewartii]|uniref:Glutathione peroxidase n=1 Tax=Polyrhizophydium stewartii TaxID=2732419 RepID=A0ABR4MXR3_9FUNG
MTTESPIYTFDVKDLRGKPVDFTQFKGKVLLIVNTASKCGLTPQFAGLEALNKKYKDQGLQIIGFPCNQFMGQEPNEGEAIQEVCQRNYGVSFPMMEKIDVNGSNAHPLYQYIKKEAPGLLGIQAIKWNFEKFVVDRNGKVVKRFAPTVTPEALEPELAQILAA